MCGCELDNNKRIFCKDCIWTRNAYNWRDHNKYNCEICNKELTGRQRRVCSASCAVFIRYTPKSRYCKMCLVHKPKGVKPMCDGDCRRIYNRLMKQKSRYGTQ